MSDGSSITIGKTETIGLYVLSEEYATLYSGAVAQIDTLSYETKVTAFSIYRNLKAGQQNGAAIAFIYAVK